MPPRSKTAAYESRIVIYAALAGNVLVAATKLFAAAWTGSSAMLSEGVHSVVDTGNELLLLYGMRRAARPPDRNHPLGHGREIYFWSFVVALLVFALGACVSVYQGVRHVLQPEPVENVGVTYVVLALSGLFDGISWLITMRTFKGKRAYSDLLAQTITRLARELAGVTHANQVFTVHLAPDQIMVALSVEFEDSLVTPDIESRVIELEQSVRKTHPAVVAVFIKPQTCRRYQEIAARLGDVGE